MGLTLGNAWVKVSAYYGSAAFLQLFAIAIMYILYKKRENRNNDEKFLIVYTIIFWSVYFFPVTAYIISTKMIGRDVYWRMFWLLPIELVIAYVLTNVIFSLKEVYKKVIFFVLGTMIIMCLGGNVYVADKFSSKENWHKLDARVLELCRIIEEDAEAKGNKKEVVVVSELLEEIRIYDANIIMPYGRNATRGENMDSEKSKQLFDAMENDTLDAYRLAFFVDKWQIPYIVYENDKDSREKLKLAGFDEIGQAGDYSVYHLNKDYSEYWLITQYGNDEGDTMTFYTIQNQDGYSILVDGGAKVYRSGVKYAISQLGNEVDAWIITTPQDKHASAFLYTYLKDKDITIHDVYSVEMPKLEEVTTQTSDDNVNTYKTFLDADMDNLHYLKKGDELELDGLKISVLSAYDDYVKSVSSDWLNDGSMVFKIKNKEQSMLFCSEIGEPMSQYLIDEYGEALESDYVQMAQNGNGGLSRDFYAYVKPVAAFFDAPSWLMNDSNDQYAISSLRRFMRNKLGTKIFHFATAPNSLFLK